ncbi:MAG: phosphoglucosamine mutase, partial [Oscillospiraceae bacterium]
LAKEIPTYPQVLHNVAIEGGNEVKQRVMNDENLFAKINEEEAILGKAGRILVRPSGTEALIRVMVECSHDELAKNAASRLASYIESEAKHFKDVN